MKKIEITTHRGGSDRFPENSLAAFLESWSQHAIPEMDVQRTSDGTLLICHDETLDRTVEELPLHLQKKAIKEIAYTEIQDLTLTTDKPSFSPPLPTLEEVLRYLKKDPKKQIVLDNKTASLTEEILPLIEYYTVEKQTWITTLSPTDLEDVRQRAPNISTQLWISAPFEEIDPLFSKALDNPAIDSILLIASSPIPSWYIEESQTKCRKKKQGLFVYYTGYTRPLVQELLGLGVRRFAVDSVTAFKQLLK